MLYFYTKGCLILTMNWQYGCDGGSGEVLQSRIVCWGRNERYLGPASKQSGEALPDSPRVPSLCTWAPWVSLLLVVLVLLRNESSQRGHHTHPGAPPPGQAAAQRSA